MTLAQTQRDFTAWLQSGSPEDAARFGPRAAPGLAIYQNNVRAQLAGCLEESFERTRQWIGGEAFHDAVVAHVTRVPPSSWTLDAYPRDFPATLALLYPGDPEVAELAVLELALAMAFVGPDAEAVTAQQVAGIDWDRAILIFVPTLDLHPLTTNAPAIWTALAQDEPPPAAELLPEAATLLTWRNGEEAQFRAIDDSEEQAILCLRNGMTFAAMCEQIVRERGEEQGVALAGALLGQWLSDGLLSV